MSSNFFSASGSKLFSHAPSSLTVNVVGVTSTGILFDLSQLQQLDRFDVHQNQLSGRPAFSSNPTHDGDNLSILFTQNDYNANQILNRSFS